MELGLAGRKAIVCASSQGLGLACAEALAREGAVVYINGRHADKLQAVGDDVARKTGASVHAVAADITSPSGRAALLTACPEPDILINNNAGPPPGTMEDWTPEVWDRTRGGRHAQPHLPDPGGAAGHAQPQVRPHRQYHLRNGQEPPTTHGALGCHAHRAHRFRESSVAGGGARQRHHQPVAARTYRLATPGRDDRTNDEESRHWLGQGTGTASPRRSQRNASAPCGSLAMPAPSCAARSRGSFLARTCNSTGVPAPASCDGRRRRGRPLRPGMSGRRRFLARTPARCSPRSSPSPKAISMLWSATVPSRMPEA